MTSKKIVCCFYLSILKKSKTNIKITLKKQLVNYYDAQGAITLGQHLCANPILLTHDIFALIHGNYVLL